MLQYITLKGIYKNGEIRLQGNVGKKIKEMSEVMILVPVDAKKGIKIIEFLLKGNYCSLGGDALNDSENFYNV